jgi:signal peptidase II
LLRAGDGVLGGRVVDFIDVQWWPVFNVADMALWVGIGLLFLAALREPEQPSDDGATGSEDGAESATSGGEA